jgi:vacuolar-type H+-ATPase subunit H
MTSVQSQASALQRPEGELNVNVTVQPAMAPIGEKMESKEGEETNTSFKQILASLAETKKYLPQQVNTFLDSMEGKTIDDLRFEAMHLANKAQEEAKRKTTETLDNVKQRAQSITDMAQGVADNAKTRTSDIKQKGVDLVNNVVQPPLQATQNTTKNLATAVNEKTTGLYSNALEYTRNTLLPMALPYAQRAQTMVVPYAEMLKPYAVQAKILLPQPAKEFVEKNVEGKSPEELAKKSMVLARTKLLNADEKSATEIPSLGQLLGEVKNATFSGKIFYNALGFTEEAANAFFGKTDVSPDATLIRRAWNLNSKVNKGMKDLTWQQLSTAGQMAKDMAYGRIDQTRQGVMSRADMVKQRISPVMTRIGQTPLVPGFVFRMLRSDNMGESGMPSGGSGGPAGTSAGLRMGMENTKGQAPEGTGAATAKSSSTAQQQNVAPPKINVNVNVVGVDTPQAPGTVSTAKTDMSTGVSATAASGNTASKTEKGTIGNTNAQGLGDLGKAGMGITTTGAETATEHHESSVPPTEGSDASSKKSKKYQSKQ